MSIALKVLSGENKDINNKKYDISLEDEEKRINFIYSVLYKRTFNEACIDHPDNDEVIVIKLKLALNTMDLLFNVKLDYVNYLNNKFERVNITPELLLDMVCSEGNGNVETFIEEYSNDEIKSKAKKVIKEVRQMPKIINKERLQRILEKVKKKLEI